MKKLRSQFLLSQLPILAVTLCAVHAADPGPDSERPLNFVIVLVDDLGWADTGCYGADLHETPNIDRLAAQGMRFTNAYAAASICSPTRASIMTGKYPARLHMTIWHEGAVRGPNRRRKLITPPAEANLPHDEVTIAEVLREDGWRTFHIGKWHLGTAAYYPETQGFDVNIGGTFWGAPSTFFYPYRGNWSRSTEYRYVPHLEFGEPGEYLTDRLTDEAVNIIDAAGDEPFFLHLAFHTVHTPIEGKKDYVDYFREKLRSDMHHTNPEYAAMVRSLDENVGLLLAKLDQRGIADRTVVIFTSDNGGFINQYRGETVTNNFPLRSGKGSLYEGGIRVPLIIRWPGTIKPNTVCDKPVISTDFYPTIIELAGLRQSPANGQGFDGVSLVSLLRDPNAQISSRSLYFHYPHYYPTTTPVSAVRDGKWKLLEYHEGDRIELYNLERDPSESNDLASSMADRAGDLRRQLHAWRDEVNAQMPTPNPDYGQ